MIGFFVFNTLIYAGFTMVTGILMPQKLKDLGIADYSSALGTIAAVGAVLSMFINVFLGALSDRTRTRFGKRSPWIVVGALLTGLGFFIISLPATWVGVGIAYCVSLIGLNMMVAPITAVLSDRIPECRRATISAAFGGGAVVGQAIGNLVAAAFIMHVLLGFGVASVLLILPAYWRLPYSRVREATVTILVNREACGRSFVGPSPRPYGVPVISGRPSCAGPV